MDYSSFKQLADKPRGVVSKPASSQPLNFRYDRQSLLAMLDDFSSFEDLMSGIGIEGSWAEDFAKVFPSFEPIACVDFDHVEDPDSYSEFLLLVDTAQPNAPVYFFSAESWRWDDWENKTDKGFVKVADSFTEFHATLSGSEGADE
jgi:hypothetical protein